MKENRSIIAALIANILIALLKFIAAFFSKSSAMLSEAVHSLSDTSNQIVLLLGKRISHKKVNLEKHPFGNERARYLASFLVAILLFFIGGIFSAFQSFTKITKLIGGDEAHMSNSILIISAVILFASIFIEGASLRIAYKEAKHKMKEDGNTKSSIFSFWKETKGSEIIVILTEDFFACIGLLIAFIAIILTIITGNHIYDAIGGLVVGGLLVFAGIMLGTETASLIIGEGISKKMRRAIKKSVKEISDDIILINMQSVHLSEKSILICLKIDAGRGRSHSEIINEIEASIRAKYPSYHFEIYIEIDKYKKRYHSSE